METQRKTEVATLEIVRAFEQGEEGGGRAHVTITEDERTLILHLQRWGTSDGSEEWRNYGFSYELRLDADGERDAVTAEGLQRLVDQYPYWLSLARAAADRPLDVRPNRTLKRDSWKPAQPGRSPAFRAEIADEFVRRFDAGENAVTEIARAHDVTPGTVSKWLTKIDDPRVKERRASRYRRSRR